LSAPSIQTDPDGSRRIVWMISRMIKQGRQLDEPVGSPDLDSVVLSQVDGGQRDGGYSCRRQSTGMPRSAIGLGEEDAMDNATTAAWMAAVGAVAAALFAIWSAVSSHRSARSSAEAVAIERGRRHQELAPRIQVQEGTFEDTSEGLWFTNDGPLDYTSVRLQVEGPGNASPVGALQFGETWFTEGDLGPVAAGARRFIAIRRNVPMPGTVLRLRLTCENDQGGWTIFREVEFTPPPMATWR
jgi:hypothetical protein